MTISKEDIKNALTKEIQSEEELENYDKIIKDTVSNSDTVKEAIKEIREEAEKDPEENNRNSEYVFEVEELPNENGENKTITSKPEETEGKPSSEPKPDEIKSKTTGDKEDEKIDENKILEGLQKLNPEYAKYKTLDELHQQITTESEETIKKRALEEASPEVQKNLINLIDNDDEIKSLLSAAGYDEMPNGTKTEWLKFADEHPSTASKIEQRIKAIGERELNEVATLKYYEKTIPSGNVKIAEAFADEIHKFVKDLYPEALEEDIKPIGEAVIKFLNKGEIDPKYFDIKDIRGKKLGVLNKERMVVDFKYNNQEMFDKIRQLAVEKSATKTATQRMAKIKDGTSTTDLASVSGTKGNVKVVNPADWRSYENLEEETIDAMLEAHRNKMFKNKNF